MATLAVASLEVNISNVNCNKTHTFSWCQPARWGGWKLSGEFIISYFVFVWINFDEKNETAINEYSKIFKNSPNSLFESLSLPRSFEDSFVWVWCTYYISFKLWLTNIFLGFVCVRLALPCTEDTLRMDSPLHPSPTWLIYQAVWPGSPLVSSYSIIFNRNYGRGKDNKTRPKCSIVAKDWLLKVLIH